MLEQALAENTAAVTLLNTNLERLFATMANGTRVNEAGQPDKPAARTPKPTATKPAAAAEPAPIKAKDEATLRSEIKQSILSLVKTGGTKHVQLVLGEYGVKTGVELPTEVLSEALDKLLDTPQQAAA